MAYTIMGFIASKDVFGQSHAELGKPLLLAQQFALLPITSSICSQFELPEWPLAYMAEEGNCQLSLPTKISNWGKNLSRLGSIGYIEAELFGGSGIKAGAIWHKGQYVLKPFASDDAINTVLKQIGVKKGEDMDEFTALNLASHG